MKKKIREIRVEGNLAYIPLTRGYEAVIDADDAPLVVGFNWFAAVARRKDGQVKVVYAVRRMPIGQAQGGLVRMHRVIMGNLDGLDVDHRDGNGLDNRRANLRLATRAENNRNARRRADNASGFKGVSRKKGRTKWVAQIKASGVKRHLGYFDLPEDAHAAYVAASVALHGEFGRLK